MGGPPTKTLNGVLNIKRFFIHLVGILSTKVLGYLSFGSKEPSLESQNCLI